jgi:sugar phosphate isomerase/epimerase
MLGSAAGLAAAGKALAREPGPAARRNRIGVSTYSYWQFRHEALRDIVKCVRTAAEQGFDGIEILHRQMTDEKNETLQAIKRAAFLEGLDLMGFSTHQTFLSPDQAKRKSNYDHTLKCLELAYALGIPTMRVNSGTWGTSKDFDELMKNRGFEPPVAGCTEEQAFGWVIDAYAQLAVEAGKRGIVMGLENHWGLGRTPEGVLRVVKAVGSPWLQATLDTGNFLDDPYPKQERMAPHAVLVQAKTYFGGGRWYTLDLDYARIAAMLRKHGYRGYISLEFEGNAEPVTGVAQSLALLRQHFGQ